MKISFSHICLVCCLIIARDVTGQSLRPKQHNHPSGNINAVSTGVNLPLGNFSSTHIVGIAAEYSLSDHRFGQMDVKPVKPVGFIINSGIAYYFGKKEMVSGYPYKYPGYTFLNLYGGIIYNPWKKGNINFTAGPALGIYNHHTRFNIGSKLEGSYYVNKNLAVSPAIILMKEHGADAFWAATVKALISF